MTDFANCFDIQAPCLSEDGSSCASFYHVGALSHALVTLTYVCTEADVELTAEFEVVADGFYTRPEEFQGFTVFSDPVVIQPGETVTLAAGIHGLLQAQTHVDLICRLHANGDPVDGASNVNGNLEIVE